MKRYGFAGRAGRRGCGGKDALSVLVGVWAPLLGAVAVRDRQPVRLKTRLPCDVGYKPQPAVDFAPHGGA